MRRINKTDRDILYKNLSFLNKLSEEEQEDILANVSKVKISKGENIYGSAGDCQGILIVKSGYLRTYLLSEEGKEVTLYWLEENELCVLSATCVLSNISFDVHIDAEEDSEIYMVKLSDLESLGDNIYLENFLLKEATAKFSDVMWAMEKILFLKFDQRLAIFLLEEVQRTGSNRVIQTHDQIAKHLGSAREVVSRMLNYFSKEEIVTLSRGEIRVLNRPALEKLAIT